jgi:glycosyltransferase involved in cell wall biosynthesis
MSDEFAQMYLESGGKNTSKFKVITNGFDRDDLPKIQIQKDEKFSIAHIGTLVKDRNPEVLWKVLSKLTKKNSDFTKQLEIKLVGKVDAFVLQELAKYNLEKYIKKIDYLPHNEVIIEQQKSKVLLLLVNNTPNSKGILTGKIFEYMMSGSPILAIGPKDGDLASLLNETKAGRICDFDNQEELENIVIKLFQQYSFNTPHSNIEKYSRHSLTKELVRILEELN